jgi:hypothetical protein
MRKDSLTDSIRRQMEGYHEQPDSSVWHNLEQQLDRAEMETGKGMHSILRSLPYVLLLLFAISPSPSINNLPSEKPLASMSFQIAATPNMDAEVNIDRDCDDNFATLFPKKDVLAKNNDLIVKMRHVQEVLPSDTAVATTTENQLEESNGSVESPEEIQELATVAAETSVSKTVKPDKSSKSPRLVSFYSSFTPSLNYFTIKPSGSDALVVSKLMHIPIASSARTSYQVDLGFQWLINNRITAYGGLSYHMQNIHLNYQYYERQNYMVRPGTDPNEYNISPVYQTGSIIYAMRNIGMQAGVLYRLQGEKLSHHAGIGLSYQHGVMAAPAGDSYNNYKSHYAYVQVLYRIEYKINPAMSAFVQPNFTQAILSKEELTAPFAITPYRVGLGFGAVFTIRK